MKKNNKEEKKENREIEAAGDNPAVISRALDLRKNILICGIKGVGKITNTVTAVKSSTNVYYLGNPVDFEGKRRPGSYEKYLQYILSLKKDLKIADDVSKLFKIKSSIVLIIDEIYGRDEAQLSQIRKLLGLENIKVIQIVGCMKYMGSLIDSIDVILELHHDGAFVIDREIGKAICATLDKK